MKRLKYRFRLRRSQTRAVSLAIEESPENMEMAWSTQGRRLRLPLSSGSVLKQSSQHANSCTLQTENRAGTNRAFIEYFTRNYLQEQAQALVEYLLMLPLIFLLIINLVNFGGFLFAWITIANAARAGANYAILGGASVGSLREATAAQISSLIAQDISSLPNQSSATVNICQNYNGAITTFQGSCSSIPSDPESTSYVLSSIDVTYTYKPFIPAGFQFPNLGIYLTLPPTTVHRRASMRVIE